jgi:hypothetical protein
MKTKKKQKFYLHKDILCNLLDSIYSRSSMASASVRFRVRSRKLSYFSRSLDGYQKILYLQLFRASEGTLSRWSLLHLQSLASTNSHWARVVGYGPFSLCLIYKEGLCLSSGDINRLVMMMTMMLST